MFANGINLDTVCYGTERLPAARASNPGSRRSAIPHPVTFHPGLLVWLLLLTFFSRLLLIVVHVTLLFVLSIHFVSYGIYF
jgi:hypothetical protein